MSNAVSQAIFGNSSGKTQEQKSLDSFSGFRVIDRAIVIHTLCDPSLRDENLDKKIIDSLKNKDDYFSAPRNSVICRLVTNNRGKIDNSDYVCFPFFSSHIMMPVKAGEQIWVVFEQPDVYTERPYWMSRITGPIIAEDANYTHLDRRFQVTHGKEDDQTDDGSGNFKTPRKLEFQNGDPNLPELATISGGQDSFKKLIDNSKEKKQTVFEPVPRVTKRPGDLVLQGSNNTAITLGTVSGWSENRRPDGSQKTSISSSTDPESGAIDIVSGRGRIYQSLEKETKKSKKSSTKNSTRPIIESNSYGFETDKNIATQQSASETKDLGNTKTNPQEGDPDFLLDASRIYLSTESKVDEMFSSGISGTAKRFDKNVEDKAGPSIAIKSDHIRIIARKNSIKKSDKKEPDDISSKQSNGTIRIIKEGNPNEDLGSITIEDDGTIHISGNKIFLGRTPDDGGEKSGDKDSPGGSQPFVKYKQLETLLMDTFDDLTTFVQKLQVNFSMNTTPGFGAPNPALIKSSADECVEFLQSIAKRKNEIKNIKSKRIFGE